MNTQFDEDLLDNDLDFEIDLGADFCQTPAPQDARRRIERHFELKRLRELLDDYDIDRELD
jgi:hypothetical protein